MKSFRLTVPLPSRRRVIAERKAFLSSRREIFFLCSLFCFFFAKLTHKHECQLLTCQMSSAAASSGCASKGTDGHERWKKENSVRKLLERFLYFSLEKRLGEDWTRWRMWKQLSDGAPSQPKFAFPTNTVSSRTSAVFAFSLVADFRGKQKRSAVISEWTPWSDGMWVTRINRGTNYISVFYWVYQFITINIYNRFSRLPRAIRIQICTKPRVGGTRGRSNNFPRSGNAARIDNDFHCYGSFLAQRPRAWSHEASTTRTHVNMKKTHWRRCSRSTIALLGSVVRSSSYSLFASNGRACFIHHAWRVARHSDSDGQASAVTTNSITTFRHLRPPTGFGVRLQPYGTHCYYLSIPLCSRFQHAESDFLGPMKEKS